MPADEAPSDGNESSDDAGPSDGATPADATVVETAAEAAESVIFSRFDDAQIEDYDVSVSFEDAILEVDVYVLAPEASADEERVADDAALAAQSAVDDLFAE